MGKKGSGKRSGGSSRGFGPSLRVERAARTHRQIGKLANSDRAHALAASIQAQGFGPRKKPKKAGLKPLAKSDQAAVKAAGRKKGKAAAELRLAAQVRATIARNNRKRGQS